MVAIVADSTAGSGQAWGDIAKALIERIIPMSSVGVCAMIKSRLLLGQSITFHPNPAYAGGEMMAALSRHFTVERCDALFQARSAWSYRIRYGDYEVFLCNGGPQFPARIRGCLFICVSGPAGQRAVLVFACLPPAAELASHLDTLERLLSGTGTGGESPQTAAARHTVEPRDS